MKKQAYNPYLPSWEYIPDGEPYVFGDRVYVYGSHDRFGGYGYCQNDYVCWSAPVDDLGDWRYEGVIYRRNADPMNQDGDMYLFAPDVTVGADGRYYLYYVLDQACVVSVAVCDTPAGTYEFYGYVHYEDGMRLGERESDEPQFDPGVLTEGEITYLYTGFCMPDDESRHGAMLTVLGKDMLTIKEEPRFVVPSKPYEKNTGYEGHAFFEASSIRRVGETYYFIYSSVLSHELCYATSDNPTEGFEFGGVLVSNGDIGLPGITDVKNARNCTGNTHGSLIEINGSYYVFYHRHSNRKQSSRQACAERIRFENGKFYQAEMTSCGLNDGPLKGKGNYPSYIACNVYGKKGTRFLSMIKHPKSGHPYLTQDGKDREQGSDQYIANMCDGAVAGFKYFDLRETSKVRINIKGKATGVVYVSTEEGGKPVAKIQVKPCKEQHGFAADVNGLGEKEALYFSYKGTGAFNFMSFDLK